MKNKYLIDSNIFIDFFKKKPPAVELISHLKRKGSLSVSPLTLMELQAGWSEKEAGFFLSRLKEIVSVKKLTDETCLYAGTLLYAYKKRGIILQPVDTLIAATAILNDLQMVTYNTRHFTPIKQLQLLKDF